MRARIFLIAALASLTSFVGGIGEAAAQGSGGTTVTSRPHPETDAIGVLLDSFVLFPSLTLGTEYNDNIFATDGNEEDDVIFTVSPQIAMQSDWGRHALGFQGSATIFRYADSQSEDVEDYTLAGNGRFDILRDTFVTASLGVKRRHEERGSADDVNGDEPTVFTTTGGEMAFSHQFNRVSTQFGGLVRHLDFNDVDAPGGSINNDDRDRMEYKTSLRVGYDLHPSAGAFVQGAFNLEDYDQTPDDDGFDRDSHGYELVGGIGFDLTGLVFGEFFAGVLSEEFEDSEFGSRQSYALGADIAWNVTPLTTLSLGASRGFEETTVDGASSALTTDVEVSADHELLRDLLLHAGSTYKIEEFEDTNRTDDTIRADLGATYLMSRFAHISLSYAYKQRFSDAQGQDFTENLVKLSVRIQY